MISESLTNACGLLKKEMQILDSLFVEAALNTRVEAGQALAVDREKFSALVTDEIKNNPNIEVISKEIKEKFELEENDTLTGDDEMINVCIATRKDDTELRDNVQDAMDAIGWNDKAKMDELMSAVLTQQPAAN